MWSTIPKQIIDRNEEEEKIIQLFHCSLLLYLLFMCRMVLIRIVNLQKHEEEEEEETNMKTFIYVIYDKKICGSGHILGIYFDQRQASITFASLKPQDTRYSFYSEKCATTPKQKRSIQFNVDLISKFELMMRYNYASNRANNANATCASSHSQ